MNNKKNILPIIAVAAFSFIVVSFLVYFFFNKNKQNQIIDSNQNTENTTSETVQPTITQTPTPTIAEIDKNIKIQVINATYPAKNGLAAVFKTKLIELGFENVSVGTAYNKEVVENSVQTKSATTSAYFKSVLSDYFPAEYTEDLKSTSTYDVVFTIGGTDLPSSKSVTPTVTPTKTATPTSTKKVVTPTEVEEE